MMKPFKTLGILSLVVICSLLLSGCGGDNGTWVSSPEPAPTGPQPESALDRRIREGIEKKTREEAEYQSKLAAGDPEAIQLRDDLAEIEAMKKENAEIEAQKTAGSSSSANKVDPAVNDGSVMKYEDKPEGDVVLIFKVGNDNAVTNGGTAPTFKIEKSYYISDLTTYHWNGGKGKSAGTLSLKSADGKIYGPWQSELVNGVYWLTKPGITIPAGSYTVIDSDPSTLAQNSGTGGQGMAWANGIQVLQ